MHPESKYDIPDTFEEFIKQEEEYEERLKLGEFLRTYLETINPSEEMSEAALEAASKLLSGHRGWK